MSIVEWCGDKEKSAGSLLRFSSYVWNANVRVVSAYLDEVVSTYMDMKGCPLGWLFGSEAPVGDGWGAAVVVAVVLGGQGQISCDHLQCATAQEALQGVSVASIPQEVDGESVAEAMDLALGIPARSPR